MLTSILPLKEHQTMFLTPLGTTPISYLSEARYLMLVTPPAWNKAGTKQEQSRNKAAVLGTKNKAAVLRTKQPCSEQSSRWDKAAGTKNKAAVLGTKNKAAVLRTKQEQSRNKADNPILAKPGTAQQEQSRNKAAVGTKQQAQRTKENY
jgi:hypothetical protein